MFRARRVMRRRAIAGTAAAGGAAYFAARRADTAPRERTHDADEPPQPPELVPVGRMEELAELREQGILTEEEFAAEKRKLLGI